MCIRGQRAERQRLACGAQAAPLWHALSALQFGSDEILVVLLATPMGTFCLTAAGYRKGRFRAQCREHARKSLGQESAQTTHERGEAT